MSHPFRPNPAGTLRLTTNTVSGTPVALITPGPFEYEIRVWNRAATAVRLHVGTSTLAAPTDPVANGASGTKAVPAGAIEVFTVSGTHVSVRGDGGATPDVEITTGNGF